MVRVRNWIIGLIIIRSRITMFVFMPMMVLVQVLGNVSGIIMVMVRHHIMHQ